MPLLTIRGGSRLFTASLNKLSQFYDAPSWVHHELSAFYAEYKNLTVWCTENADHSFTLVISSVGELTPSQRARVEQVEKSIQTLVESEYHGSHH